jgi:predicted PurR-regulated permease PerM
MVDDDETPLSLAKRLTSNGHNPLARAKEDAPRMRSHLSSIRRSMAFLAVLAGIAAMWVAKDILLPLSLAVMLSLILGPLVSALERLRVPAGIAAFLVVLMTTAIFVSCALVLEPSVRDMIERAPEIANAVEEKLRPVKESLGTIQQASKELENLTQVGDAPAAVAAPAAAPLTPALLESVPEFLLQAIFVLILTLFALSSRNVYRKRIILLSHKRETRLRIARIMSEVSNQVSEYLLAITVINIGLGLAVATAFTIAGIDEPLLWGLIFAVANYIPYVGPIGTMLACGVVQIVTADSLGAALIGPGIMFVLNQIESDLVTPWFVSRKISVSSLAVLLTVAIITWLWGVFASFVAVPMLILFNAIARHVPTLEPIAYLLSGEHNDSRQQAVASRRGLRVDEPEPVSPWWQRITHPLRLIVDRRS